MAFGGTPTSFQKSFTPNRPNAPFTPSQQNSGNRENAYFLTPATIQLLQKLASTSGEQLTLSGQPVGNIELVGSVRTVTEQTNTRYDFLLDDSTGCIKCNYWSPEQQVIAEITDNSYVRVYGKFDKNTGEIQVFGMKMVGDFNEIAHHYLNAMYNYKSRTQGKPMQQQPQGENINFGDQNEATGEDEVWANIAYAKDIMRVLKSCSSDTGMEVTEIISATSLNGVDAELKKALMQLCEDGCIYTTIDEDHFSAAA